MTPSADDDLACPSSARFATTQWTMVLRARDREGSESMEAWEALCRAYWPPLYAYVRREGYVSAEAQDLTQEFVARLLERNYLSRLEPQRGRFRSFLLAFLKNFLSEQRGRANAQKRGGGKSIISLDQMTEEDRLELGAPNQLSPEEMYERRWAETVMERARLRLEAEYAAAGQSALFDLLKDFHPRDPAGLSQAQIAERLGLTEAAVKSSAQRMRRKHREIVRAEIALLVSDVAEIEDEMRCLRQVLERAGGAIG
jgi:RNA polymerase sigma factor (sigma-70 family)